ncbi:MAG: AAA family ATPase, partial [Acidimicrobiia bacterium]|nr:AAA family ATPase [Acidimicrobiia bacterium]
MRLKSIRLLGFKSFADRTLLEFGTGVSVVVGPNGTGKSNIVDAVSWVLGTQFTRALRADQMDDVVFAGTADRPAHSRAEVTLVMDNSDRSVPLNLDEVAVTRRLFKGGTSEYEINGAPCRLLDIQELLSDSGLGRRQHLIVGQGRLDTVLGGSPAQRREIIEDAAGIRKHRIRKAKAIRRLEQSDADAVRLRDIAGEMERRKRPLRRQARDAERYEEMRSELGSLRLWLG